MSTFFSKRHAHRMKCNNGGTQTVICGSNKVRGAVGENSEVIYWTEWQFYQTDLSQTHECRLLIELSLFFVDVISTSRLIENEWRDDKNVTIEHIDECAQTTVTTQPLLCVGADKDRLICQMLAPELPSGAKNDPTTISTTRCKENDRSKSSHNSIGYLMFYYDIYWVFHR